MTDADPLANRSEPDSLPPSWLIATGISVLLALIFFVGFGVGQEWGAPQWGPLAEWLAGAATFAAVAVALYIAGRDRQVRLAERHAEEKTHARLVLLSVETETGRPVVIVQARNFGPLPVLDVRLVEATWSEHPEARWVPMDSSWQPKGLPRNSVHRPILKPTQGLADTFDTLADFNISFMHPDKDRTLVPVSKPMKFPQYARTDVSKVVAKIQFTTANGVRWETPTQGVGAGEPRRLS